MSAQARESRFGFTVIELLVVIASAAILTSISIIGIRAATEGTRSTQCRNNLRQLGWALTEYHDTHRVYPMGLGGPTEMLGQFYKIDRFSVPARLLPFLGETRIYNEINWKLNIDDQENKKVFSIPSPSFLRCTSEDSPSNRGVNLQICMGSDAWMLMDHGVALFKATRQGIFQYVRVNAQADITDGLDNTVAFSERLEGSQQNIRRYKNVARIVNKETTPVQINNWTHRCAAIDESYSQWRAYGQSWISGEDQGYNHILPPNYRIFDCTDMTGSPPMGVVTARSNHGGSVNMAFASGRVERIDDGIDLDAYRALATRASGD